jgi:DNA polymerase III delta subunit
MPEYCLIINSGRTSGSPKWAQALSAHTQHITLWPPSLQEFPDFIQKQAQGCGLRFSSPQLQRITAAYEGNLAGFSQFLIQLSTSQHSTPPRQDGTPSAHHSRQPSPQVISDDMLESHLMTFAQFNLFEAAPAILSGDLTRVHAILSYFEMHEPQDLVPLLSILAKEFRTLHACIVAYGLRHNRHINTLFDI